MGMHGGGGAHRLSSRRFIFAGHAIQRLRERLGSGAVELISLSDLEIESRLDRLLSRALDGSSKCSARFRDGHGEGLAVEVVPEPGHILTAIIRPDRGTGKLRVVASIINRGLFDLLFFWLQEGRSDRTILAPEFMEPRLLRWTENGHRQEQEIHAFQAERSFAELVRRGIPITEIYVWRPVKVTLDLTMVE